MIPGTSAAQKALARVGQELSWNYALAMELSADGGVFIVRRIGGRNELRILWAGEVSDGMLLVRIQDWQDAGEPDETWVC